MELLINIVGGVALLLWGVRMVRTGLNRALGSGLRRLLASSTRNRITAFFAGLGVTGLLQSSTATAMIVAAFAGRGLFPTAMGLALILGADVGSTLIVQILSFDLNWLSPVLIAAGVAAFLSGNGSYRRGLARAGIGLGLILLSLKLIVTASAPLRDAGGLNVLLAALNDELILAVLLAAAITWLAHSSVAIVLLVMSFAALQVIALPLALAMVLGANIGSAITALSITAKSPALARRVPLGNLIMRGIGVAGVIGFIPYILPYLAQLDPEPTRMVANFHTAFNLALALIFLPALGLISTLTERLLPEGPASNDPGQPRYLDAEALENPAVALAAAARETLHMGDEVRTMLRQTRDVLAANDLSLVQQIAARDDVVDRLHEAIKLYLTRLSRLELDDRESRTSIEILSFTTNLEHIGDVIDRNLMELAAKKIKSQIDFSPEGKQELEQLLDRVIANFDLALNVFMSGDRTLARKLMRSKDDMRDLERTLVESHYTRVAEGRPESVRSSSLHLDILRDLKRINGHLTTVAHPILESSGELAASRLVTLDD